MTRWRMESAMISKSQGVEMDRRRLPPYHKLRSKSNASSPKSRRIKSYNSSGYFCQPPLLRGCSTLVNAATGILSMEVSQNNWWSNNIIKWLLSTLGKINSTGKPRTVPPLKGARPPPLTQRHWIKSKLKAKRSCLCTLSSRLPAPPQANFTMLTHLRWWYSAINSVEVGQQLAHPKTCSISHLHQIRFSGMTVIKIWGLISQCPKGRGTT